ncbi:MULTISPECIES: DUF7261 family protein [Salinibaculum]|uniref:DUF7261 family protein n=1 Tax=Salinibaculum TaxID=2732368 RepID=UPI0030D0BB39
MSRRGQLVLLAAAALAIALVPMTVAHLQLGYSADIETASVDETTLADAQQTLQRALDDATASVPSRYTWSNRSGAVTSVHDSLAPTFEAMHTARLDAGTVVRVSYNGTRAREWAARHCPGGPNRNFGSCVADRGVVVQERAGDTHVLAAAVDVRVTTERRDASLLTVVRTVSARTP